MSYLQSAIEYADEWLEFDPTKSRYNIKPALKSDSSNSEDVNMESDNKESVILPDKDKTNFITRINSRFMGL